VKNQPDEIHVSRITFHAVTMNRLVQPELLDELPPDDPRARWSRRDLRRINAWMRNHSIMAKALQTAANGYAPKQITDLGAGDGNLLFRVAREISPHWRDMNMTLLDRQNNMASQTLASFASMGWHAEAVEADVFDWLPTAAGLDVVVANLFLHHFEGARLVELFRAIASRARLFVAIEPRRASWPLFCCRWLWAIGCNSVTRHDAVISVRAGFSGQELSVLWPADGGWQLTERRSGFFSHLFVARRMD
jgi:methyltransferase family protein